MSVVYVTRLRLRSRWLIPRFLWANLPIMKQLGKAPGYLGGRSILEARAVFWTMSLWRDEAAMRAFKVSGAHGAAIPKNLDWSVESSGAGWARDTLPTWGEAYSHMVAHGRATPVRAPSPDHASLNYAQPKALLHFALPVTRDTAKLDGAAHVAVVDKPPPPA